MRLSSLISEERILVNIEGETVADGVKALLDCLSDDLSEQALARVDQEMAQRREVTSDFLGDAVVAPHLRSEAVSDFILCVGTSLNGLRLAPPTDTQPDPDARAHLIFLALTPLTQNTLMLQTLAAIARLCFNAETRAALSKCKNPARILKLIEESDVEVKRALTANDASRACPEPLSPHDDLGTVLCRLAKARERALPVVDDNGVYVGAVSPAGILRIGLPKYVGVLSDVDFLANFEPFEKVFLNERKLVATELASDSVAPVYEDTPIIHVAHLMVSEGAPVVFVLDAQDRPVGMIDEHDILARVLLS